MLCPHPFRNPQIKILRQYMTDNCINLSVHRSINRVDSTVVDKRRYSLVNTKLIQIFVIRLHHLTISIPVNRDHHRTHSKYHTFRNIKMCSIFSNNDCSIPNRRVPSITKKCRIIRNGCRMHTEETGIFVNNRRYSKGGGAAINV